MLKVFWKWLNHGIQSCQWKHLLFSLPQKGNIFQKKKEKKLLNLSFDFSPFFQPKHTKYEKRTRKESRSRAKKSCFLYEIVLVFNSINTKLLFRHRPSVGDARRGWLPEVAWQRQRLHWSFLPTASNAAWTPTQNSPWLPTLQLGD